jgi:hypothetical protein
MNEDTNQMFASRRQNLMKKIDVPIHHTGDHIWELRWQDTKRASLYFSSE